MKTSKNRRLLRFIFKFHSKRQNPIFFLAELHLRLYAYGGKMITHPVTLGSNMKFIAATNFSSENSSTGIGGGPTPLAWTRSPQNGWSPKNGTTVVGHWKQQHMIRCKIREINMERFKPLNRKQHRYRSFKTSSSCPSPSMMHLEKYLTST